ATPIAQGAIQQDRGFKAMAAALPVDFTRYRLTGPRWPDVRNEFADTAVLYVGDFGFAPRPRPANALQETHNHRFLYRIIATPLALHVEVIGLEALDADGASVWMAMPRGMVVQRWAVQRARPAQTLTFDAATVDPDVAGRVTLPYTLDGEAGELQFQTLNGLRPGDNFTVSRRNTASHGWLSDQRTFTSGVWHLGSPGITLLDAGTIVGDWPVPTGVKAIELGFDDDGESVGIYDYENDADGMGRTMRLRAIRPGAPGEMLDAQIVWESPDGPPNLGEAAGHFIKRVSPTHITIGDHERFTQMTAELLETRGPFVFAPADVKLTDGRTHLVRDSSGRTTFHDADGSVIPVEFDALPPPPPARSHADFNNGHVAVINAEVSTLTVGDARGGTSWNVALEALLGPIPTRPRRAPQLRISPDGKHLAVIIASSSVDPSTNPRLVLVNLDDQTTLELPMVHPELQLHAWSDNGRRLLLSGGSELYLFDVTTDTLMRLQHAEIWPWSRTHRHAISHDGRHVASLVREAGRRQRVVWWTVP
ncbi:MAG: hypothetical protein AAF656_13265, partial [Planctomycetota bacterium]